jgi:hypothetical protein
MKGGPRRAEKIGGRRGTSQILFNYLEVELRRAGVELAFGAPEPARFLTTDATGRLLILAFSNSNHLEDCRNLEADLRAIITRVRNTG